MMLVILSVFVTAGIIFFSSGLHQSLFSEINSILYRTREFGWKKDTRVFRFFMAALEALQLFPILLILSWKDIQISRASQQLLFLCLLFPAALVLIGAPFWTRHFIPVLALLILMTIPKIDSFLKRPGAMLYLLLIYVSSNGLALYWHQIN
jgi:hypothetical protein